MKYLIIKESLVDTTQFIDDTDSRLVFKEMYELQNLACIQISDELFGIFSKLWTGKYIEIEENQAKLGSSLFAEVRAKGKVWESTNVDATGEYREGADYPEYGKVAIEMTPEVTSSVLGFMKIFAKELIEDEYERRFINLRNNNTLEASSWEIQKHEAREWLAHSGAEGHETPFLDYLATEKDIDKTALANKILQKAETYQDKLSTMLVDMQKLMKKFENASSIKDINILYEDYLGVMMPTSQAVELGRTVSETDWERKPEYEVNLNEYNF
jgi:hypothetical protein|tara:strand:- start:4808 stop:5620 length:813 start_codon:yes stop_codon:yes gene_type:complete